MTDRQKELIRVAGLSESDFSPKETNDRNRIEELERSNAELREALDALLRGETDAD